MSDFIKTVVITGNLKSHPLSYRIVNEEFSDYGSGVWVFGITGAALKAKEDINVCTHLTSNFIVSQRYSKSGAIETYEEPLVNFRLKTLNGGLIQLQPSKILIPCRKFKNPYYSNLHVIGLFKHMI